MNSTPSMKSILTRSAQTFFRRPALWRGFLTCAILLALAPAARAATYYDWRDVSGSGHWNYSGTGDSDYHWWDGAANRNFPTSGGCTYIRVNNNTQTSWDQNISGFSCSGIEFQSGATTTRYLWDQAITFYDCGGVYPYIKNSSATYHEIQVGIIGSASFPLELRVPSGDLGFTATATINNNGQSLNVWGNNGHTLTLGGIVSGSGGLVVEDNNKVVLTNANTYSGGTTVSAGILEADANTALGTGLLTMNGGALSNNVSATLTNKINLAVGSTVGVATNQTLTLGGALTNSGALTKVGIGTLVLTNNNTLYAGTITNCNNIGVPLGATSSGGALVLSNYIGATNITIGNTSVGGTPANSYACLQLGANNVLPANASLIFDDLNGSHYSYLKLMGNTLTIGYLTNLDATTMSGSLSTGAIIQNDGSDAATSQVGTLIVSNAQNATYSGRIRNNNSNIAGNGKVQLIKDGAGTLFLNGCYYGPLTYYTAGTTIKNGTLDISGIIGPVYANGSSANTFSYNAPITNAGGIFAIGSVNLTNISYLQLTGNGTITGTGNITNNSAAYDLQSGTVNCGLAGTAGLTKTTAGTVTLSGANGYSGATTISVGTLALGASGSINSSTGISIAAGATYDVSAISSYTLSGSTSLSAAGTGTAVGSTAATIKGGTTVSLGSQAITLTYDGSHPALYVSQGTLSLNGNAFTVNSASPLADGTYVIVQQASGNITSSGAYPVAGTAIGFGTWGSVSVSGGNVVLTIRNETTTTSSFTTAGNQTWTCPNNVYSVQVECYGGGGGGGGGLCKLQLGRRWCRWFLFEIHGECYPWNNI